MVFFRFPFSETLLTTEQNFASQNVSFHSFDQSERIDFEGDLKEISFSDFQNLNFLSSNLSSELIDFQEEKQVEYQQKLENVIDFIKENNLSKLVISRRKLVGFDEFSVDLNQTFLNLCQSYPNAFVYFFIKDDRCWIGAFSEVLGKFNKKTSEFETMSLAGTIPVEENWTSKELEEQKPVTLFIKNILKNFASEVNESETYDHISGNIKHLRTDFKAKIEKSELESLIAELHPTPAVCGIPKDFCQKAIENFEPHPRKFYAGYIQLETAQTIQYFVNLRCAEFFKNAALIYVGGGITAESSPEKEWQVTELKSQAILKNLEKKKN